MVFCLTWLTYNLPNLRWFFSAIQFILRSVKYNCVLWFNIASCDLYIILYHIILYYIIYYIILYLYYIILYYIILHSVILYCIIWNKIASHGFILCNITLYCVQWNDITSYCLYCTIWVYGASWEKCLPENNIARYSFKLGNVILYCVIWNNIAWYEVILILVISHCVLSLQW